MNAPIDQPPALGTQALETWHDALAQAFIQVDEARFLDYLAAALCALCPIESMMISLERQGQAPRLLYQQGIPREHQDEIIHRYFSRGYQLDPFCLAVDKGLAEGFYSLAQIAPDDFFHSEYYKTYYLRSGGALESYHIVDLCPRSKISLCMFQGLSAGQFSDAQLAVQRSAHPVIRALLHRFGTTGGLDKVVGDPAFSQTRVHQQIEAAFMGFGSGLLTVREREIAHLILRGHSVKSAAQVLGISPETVRMHRKHVYTKLVINSQAELFALFIDWMTRQQ
ncbi:helix-turn-helix domain-containing protein [Pseudomonas canadensis]|uniref:helix-turn-helix domain-containing protein n=1 Tax=Pseudomonas canadensis TaxID=915099 RepID=UPI003BA3CFEE